MSITVHQSPEPNSPAYNDLLYLMSESSGSVYSQPNFKYIADVFVNSNKIARLKSPIYPNSTNKGVFNIGRLIENFVTYDWNINDTTASGCPNSYIGYQVKFGYEYSTGSTSPIIEASGLTTVTGNAYNMALDPITFANFDEDTYLLKSNTAKFLTSNRSKRIYSDQKDWIYFWKGDANSVLITYYPSATPNPILLSGLTDKVIRIPIVSIPSGTTYLTIQAQQSGTNKSELYRIDIKEGCSKYGNNDVYFLNRYGAIESFRFNMVRKDKHSISRKQYKQNPYQLSGNTYTYETSARSNSNFYTESKQTTTLNSDWITESESKWLKELIQSPIIWMLDDGILKAVNIVNSDYEVKYQVNEKMFNINIQVEHSFTDKTQRL